MIVGVGFRGILLWVGMLVMVAVSVTVPMRDTRQTANCRGLNAIRLMGVVTTNMQQLRCRQQQQLQHGNTSGER